MQNPFETIDARLGNIERLLLDIKHPQVEDPKQLITYVSIAEAASILSLSRPTLYEAIKDGRLTKHKIGRTTRLLKSEVLSMAKPI